MHVALENLLNWGQVDRVSVDLVAALIIVEDGPTLCLTWPLVVSHATCTGKKPNPYNLCKGLWPVRLTIIWVSWHNCRNCIGVASCTLWSQWLTISMVALSTQGYVVYSLTLSSVHVWLIDSSLHVHGLIPHPSLGSQGLTSSGLLC